MPTLRVLPDRRAFFRDADGTTATYKARDTVDDYSFDWSRALLTDEVIATVAWTSDGNVHVADSSNTETTTTARITGTDGTLICIVTVAVPEPPPVEPVPEPDPTAPVPVEPPLRTLMRTIRFYAPDNDTRRRY